MILGVQAVKNYTVVSEVLMPVLIKTVLWHVILDSVVEIN